MNQTPETRAADIAALPANRDQRRAELAEVAFKPGQLFQPTNGRELMDMANLMSKAGPMVKDIYRDNAGACMALIAICAPYGLNPLMVSWKTYQTKPDAPMAYEAQVVIAMINASGVVPGGLRYRYEGEGPERRCTCYGTLRGETEPLEVVTPMLKDIGIKNSPLWKNDPDQQLAYYSGRAWGRRYKPEMFLGIYTTDEIETPRGPDHARDVTPRAVPRRGGVVYRDEIEQDAPAAPAETPHDPETGEAIEGTEDAEVVAPPLDDAEADRLAAQIKAEIDAQRQGDLLEG